MYTSLRGNTNHGKMGFNFDLDHDAVYSARKMLKMPKYLLFG